MPYISLILFGFSVLFYKENVLVISETPLMHKVLYFILCGFLYSGSYPKSFCKFITVI